MSYTFNTPIKGEILDTVWEILTNSLPLPGGYRVAPQGDQANIEADRGVIDILAGPTRIEARDETRLSSSGSDLSSETTGHRELTLIVDYFGANASDYSSKAASLFEVVSFCESLHLKHVELHNKALKVIDCMGSQEIPNVLQSDYEPRFRVTIMLRTVSSIIETTGTIDSIKGEGELIKSDNSAESVGIDSSIT